MAWDQPLGYTREFIDGLQPLLAGAPADVDGSQVTTHAELNISAAGHADPARRARPADARPRRPARAGHDRRPVRPAHDRHAHRAAAPRRGRGGRPAGAAHHGAHPHLRHRRPRRRVRPRPGDGDAVPDGAVVRHGAGHGGLDDPAELHLIGSWSRSSTGWRATPRPGSPTTASRSPHPTPRREATRARSPTT